MSTIEDKIKELEFRLTGLEQRVDEVLNNKLVHMAGRITRDENRVTELQEKTSNISQHITRRMRR